MHNSKYILVSKIAPFNLLPVHLLEQVVSQLQEIHFKRNTVLYKQEQTVMRGVDIIVSGEYESYFMDNLHNKRLAAKHVAGKIYGGISILFNNNKSLKTVVAQKNTTVYTLPSESFLTLCSQHKPFEEYFAAGFVKLMQNKEYLHFFKNADTVGMDNDQMYSQKISQIEYREIISCSQETTIASAASLMNENKVSCLFVTNDVQDIIGYVTDITLRNNVVITARNLLDPIEAIMDNPIVSIQSDAYIYEALLMMLLNKTRYLLIKDQHKFIGYVSRNKLLSEQSHSPLVFIQSVKFAISDDELKRKWQEVPNMVMQLLDKGVHAEIINQLITALSDTIALNIINQAIHILGTPPAKFAFMVLGSEGRKEQTLKTDQDNAIVYEDKANEQRELVRDYFLRFATLVSDKLHYVGFSYCAGNLMAKNPKWTHSLSHWKNNYQSWITEMDKTNVMKFATFFDCRYLYGDETLINELKLFMHEALMKPNLDNFYSHLANNALQLEPPLTFFKNIRTTKQNKQHGFDIKTTMTPIVDLVRVHALRNNVFEVNTGERLRVLQQKNVFTEQEYQELRLSYYLLMRLRLRSQARQIIEAQEAPSNFIKLSSLANIEQVTLREIFKTIELFQKNMRITFTSNIFGTSYH
jgi:CBS domain-containing protein